MLEHIYGHSVFIVKQMKKQKKIVYQKKNVLLYLVLKQKHQVHYVQMNNSLMMKIYQLQHVHVMLIVQIMIMLYQYNHNSNNIEMFLILLKQVVDNVCLLDEDMKKQMFKYNIWIHIKIHLLSWTLNLALCSNNLLTCYSLNLLWCTFSLFIFYVVLQQTILYQKKRSI